MAIRPSNAEPVIVVGAGAAGLAAGDALARQGIAAVLLEKEARSAEPWRRRHPQLNLNTHRHFSALPGVPYPDKTPAYPKRDTVAAYLDTYAAKRGLSVEYGVEVTRIERDRDGWIVQTNAGPRRTRHVVVATGRDRAPWTPDWPGREGFAGRIVHSADFGDVHAYEGKRILVVGGGNSAFDALNHLARVKTENIWFSLRHGPSLLPKRISSISVHRLSGVLEWMPVRWVDWILAATQRVVFGDLSRYGMPKRKDGGASRLDSEQIAIAVDEGAVKALKAGRIRMAAPIAKFGPEGVILQDGNVIQPDIVIAATGYRSGLEPMVGDLGVLDEHGSPKVTPKHLSPLPGLWFLGMRPGLTGDFRSSVVQGQRIAKAIAKSG
ncbi:NAD(P)/FAD-dependent oxidoreductase [Mesorhizobium sp. BE184]|uniref:flavin-containing monooxygenase n=1 Tax=Mesorhizobium sp. BE184 TaxID=2817714 RepID=UPI00285DC68B|nr:NAD(P)/FAD-dependent oxidoreductase [Mesorhizobium sp. BE184]MDR7031497.1 cation diffusion facilitator CzcD-associated flavoprotein CzcO [Mesorhizobium sp. BE184]